jgi:hypothetical protein
MTNYDMFKCMDCGINTKDINEYYMVEDELWLKAVPEDEGMLCIGCLEKRLGRKLNKNDFPHFPVNMPFKFHFIVSDRLLNRLGYVD